MIHGQAAHPPARDSPGFARRSPPAFPGCRRPGVDPPRNKRPRLDYRTPKSRAPNYSPPSGGHNVRNRVHTAASLAGARQDFESPARRILHPQLHQRGRGGSNTQQSMSMERGNFSSSLGFIPSCPDSPQIATVPKPRWKQLTHRRLQAWPSELVKNKLLDSPLPPWLENPVIPRLTSIPVSDSDSTRLFASSPHCRPNHVLINEYPPGVGIMPHKLSTQEGPSRPGHPRQFGKETRREYSAHIPSRMVMRTGQLYAPSV